MQKKETRCAVPSPRKFVAPGYTETFSSIHDTYTHLSHTKHFAKKKGQIVRVPLCNIIINSSSEIKI